MALGMCPQRHCEFGLASSCTSIGTLLLHTKHARRICARDLSCYFSLPEVEVAQNGAVSLHPLVFSLLRDPCNHSHLSEPKRLATVMFDPLWITDLSPQRLPTLEGVARWVALRSSHPYDLLLLLLRTGSCDRCHA